MSHLYLLGRRVFGLTQRDPAPATRSENNDVAFLTEPWTGTGARVLAVVTPPPVAGFGPPIAPNRVMSQTIPKQMKAAAIDRFGGPDVLHVQSLPVPRPGGRQVLVRVETAGVGVWDPFVREGGFDEDHSTKFPHVLGNDGAGEVVAIGDDVDGLAIGDHVYGFWMKGGFYAEYVTIDADNVARIPSGVDASEAGALGADGITAVCGLDELDLKRGQSLMIIGASGGIGHIAVQLAKRMGVRVLAVASQRDGVELVQRIGADKVIDGRRDDIVRAARELAPEGIDAALVLAGGASVDQSLSAVKKGGIVAHPNGVEPVPSAPKGVAVVAYNGVASREKFDELNALIGDTPFHVELGQVYGLDDVAQAHRDVEQHHLGKLALRLH